MVQGVWQRTTERRPFLAAYFFTKGLPPLRGATITLSQCGHLISVSLVTSKEAKIVFPQFGQSSPTGFDITSPRESPVCQSRSGDSGSFRTGQSPTPEQC